MGDIAVYAWASILAVVVGGSVAALAVMTRRRRRRCDACKIEMRALSEHADDAHLDAGQRTEERILSVNYEVLVCPSCKATRTLRHSRWMSGRSRCTKCGYKTSSAGSRTVSAATEASEGIEHVTVECEHCGHEETFTHSIPRAITTSSDT